MSATGMRDLTAGAAFDSLAARYDELFTNSLVGRAQRDAVWEVVDQTFAPGARILELNSGTGEDALHLAARGVTVVGCDASASMIEVARRKVRTELPSASVNFYHLPIERVSELAFRGPFEGVFSNFSGLNCIEDLNDVADQLASLVRPGTRLLICVSTRVCLWEVVVYGLQANWNKAGRRIRGQARASVGGVEVAVSYPTLRQMKAAFKPWFRHVSTTAIGLAVPPSYMESWCRRHPSFLRFARRVDHALCKLPLLRVLGDHMLLTFERCEK